MANQWWFRFNGPVNKLLAGCSRSGKKIGPSLKRREAVRTFEWKKWKWWHQLMGRLFPFWKKTRAIKILHLKKRICFERSKRRQIRNNNNSNINNSKDNNNNRSNNNSNNRKLEKEFAFFHSKLEFWKMSSTERNQNTFLLKWKTRRS